MRRCLAPTILVGVSLLAAVGSAQSYDPCDLSWSLDAFDRLWISHEVNANCGISWFEYDAWVEEGVIHVREHGLCPMGLMDCTCPYGTDLVLTVPEPGEYTVDWQWAEVDLSVPYPQWVWIECAFTVTIPGGSDPVRFQKAGYVNRPEA